MIFGLLGLKGVAVVSAGCPAPPLPATNTTTATTASSTSTTTVPPAIITVTPSSLLLEVGQTMQLTATVNNPGMFPSVIWTSENSSIASVSPTGVGSAVAVVTALAVGDTRIRATATTDATIFGTASVRVGPRIGAAQPQSIR